jgi:NTE family protein
VTSIALVLGAGGVIGGAYHAGTIAAIEEVTGWDARSAGLLVGTSAGASIAASLRTGFSPGDHQRHACDDELSPAGNELAGATQERLRLPDRPPMRWPIPAAPWLAFPAFLSRGSIRPGLLVGGLLPRGTIDSSVLGDPVRAITGDRWPAMPTWICATRLRDGKRVVFGRDDVETPDLGRAVEASAAVPGYFRPVKIGSNDYLDGGSWSPTNADLVAGLGFDLVVVVSTMSAVPRVIGPRPRSLDLMTRAMHGRTLAREVKRIRDRGSPVLTIQPTAECIEVMGRDPLAHDRSPDVARQAKQSVTALLARTDLRDSVRILERSADGDNSSAG